MGKRALGQTSLYGKSVARDDRFAANFRRRGIHLPGTGLGPADSGVERFWERLPGRGTEDYCAEQGDGETFISPGTRSGSVRIKTNHCRIFATAMPRLGGVGDCSAAFG